jgi:predicted transglutaminase-like cysteine proteinase
MGFGFLCISAMPATALESYFINQEVRADNVEMFPKWMSMLAHYDAESHTLDTICGSDQYDTCKLKTWSQYIESLRGKPRLEQMDAINSYINQYPYIEDIVNWGVDDYWATVYEFQRKSGDCEDYAIAKWTSLRALGVPNDDMRIEIVQDLSLGGIIHAVLVVYVADKMYVLDNQIKRVTLASDIYHYKPIYSINETHWWQHIITQ